MVHSQFSMCLSTLNRILLHLNFHETRIIYIAHLFRDPQILFCAHKHLGEIMSKFPLLTIHIAVLTLGRPTGKMRNFKSTESMFDNLQSLVQLYIRLMLRFHSCFKFDPLSQCGRPQSRVNIYISCVESTNCSSLE
jgi:hypothetical protein